MAPRSTEWEYYVRYHLTMEKCMDRDRRQILQFYIFKNKIIPLTS
jgi:hypothetical protein